MSKYFGDTEITDFECAVLHEEDVLCFEISVYNFAVMHVLQSKTYLREPVEHLAFGDVPAFVLEDLFAEISAIAIIHYNAKFLLSSSIDLLEFDDVRMIESFKDTRFSDGFFFLLIFHCLHVHFFDHAETPIAFAFHQKCFAEGTLT